jgi:hypothetical protein
VTNPPSSLLDLETTDSGSVRKSDAMQWMKQLDDPDEDELIAAVQPKDNDHTGSTFATPISNIRVTGTPEFLTEVAKLLTPLLAWESSATRLALKVQQIKDRETDELTDNYALYLSAAMRGRESSMANAVLGKNREQDQRLKKALNR